MAKTGCVLAESTDGALMVHLYHIFSGWFSVLISCIHAAKPYLDSEPFSWLLTHKRAPVAAETMALLLVRQVLGQYSPNRARSRHLRGGTAYASPTAFGAAICDIPPRHRDVVGVRGGGPVNSFDRCRRR